MLSLLFFVRVGLKDPVRLFSFIDFGGIPTECKGRPGVLQTIYNSHAVVISLLTRGVEGN